MPVGQRLIFPKLRDSVGSGRVGQVASTDLIAAASDGVTQRSYAAFTAIWRAT